MCQTRKALKRAQNNALVVMCISYCLLIPYVFMFLDKLSKRSCALSEQLTEQVFDLITLDSVVIWTVQFYVGYYGGIVVCVDGLSHILLQLHRDGFGKDAQYVGLESIVARLGTSPKVT